MCVNRGNRFSKIGSDCNNRKSFIKRIEKLSLNFHHMLPLSGLLCIIHVVSGFIYMQYFLCCFYSLFITGAFQMMLPVLLSESFVYHHMQNPAVVRV